MDAKKKKKRGKKKKAAKVGEKCKKKNCTICQHVSAVVKVELEKKIAFLGKELEGKLVFEKSLEQEIQAYDKLIHEEMLEKIECANILQKVIAEAEMVNEMYEMNFKRWMKQSYEELRTREFELEQAKQKCEEAVQKKIAEKADLEKTLETLEDFQTKKDEFVHELKVKESLIKEKELEFLSSMQETDDLFITRLSRIGDDLKCHLEEAAETQRNDVINKETWIMDIVDETIRTKSYHKEFELKTRALREEYPSLKSSVQFLKAKLAESNPGLQEIISTVRKRRDIISFYKNQLKGMEVPRKTLKSLDIEHKILREVHDRLRDKLCRISTMHDKNQKEYQDILQKIEALTLSRIHETFAELSQKVIRARNFIQHEICEALETVSFGDHIQASLLVPLGVLEDASYALDDDTLNRIRKTVKNQIQEKLQI